MLKSELLQLIENIEDNSSVDEVLQGTDLAKSMLSLDKFKEMVATDKDFKSFLDSEKDKHSSKSLETWKSNNLSKLIEEEVKKRYPEKDEKDIKLETLQAELDKMKHENLMKEIKNQALLLLDEKKLPKEMLDFVVSDDLDKTKGNIETITKVFNPYIQKMVEERVKDNSYTPPKGGEPTGNNPYEKGENFSLTKQMELEISNPELAKQLREQAK